MLNGKRVIHGHGIVNSSSSKGKPSYEYYIPSAMASKPGVTDTLPCGSHLPPAPTAPFSRIIFCHVTTHVQEELDPGPVGEPKKKRAAALGPSVPDGDKSLRDERGRWVFWQLGKWTHKWVFFSSSFLLVPVFVHSGTNTP